MSTRAAPASKRSSARAGPAMHRPHASSSVRRGSFMAPRRSCRLGRRSLVRQAAGLVLVALGAGPVGQGAVAIGVAVVAVEADGGVEIGNGPIVILEVVEEQAAVVVGDGQVRIEANGLVEVGN